MSKVPEIAQQLTACGVAVFPCWDNKQPAVKGGFKAASVRPGNYWPSALVGVPVPEGMVIIDIDAHKGMTCALIEQALGCQLDWSGSLLQFTPSGGAHYAFRTAATIRQGSDLFADKIGKGFDTRVPGRGYICVGGGYIPGDSLGVLRLATVDMLPELPATAVDALSAAADLQHEPAPLPTGDRNSTEVQAMLRCLDADCSRSDWLQVGLALKHHYHDDDATGFTLFDNWSMTGANAYDPVEARKLWETIKPTADDGKAPVTLGTLVHKAIKNGYVPSSVAADVFGAGGAGEPSAALSDVETLIGRINAEGGKPEMVDELTTAIRAMSCNSIQRAALTAALQRVLKDHGIKITERELKQATSPQQQQPLIIPQPVDGITAFHELKIQPIDALGNVHILNASMLRQAVFGRRLARVGGEAYWWDGSSWNYVSKADLSSAVAHAFMGSDYGKDSNINGTRNQLLNVIPCFQQLGPADSRVYFKNGVFDLRRADLGIQPHDPDHLNTYTLEVDYRPGQPHPEWDAFLMSCFGSEPERIQLLQEIMGWWLISDNLGHQKAVAFDGVTRSGKGTIFRMIDAIMGSGVTDVSLAQLADNKSVSSMRNAALAVDRDSKRPPQRDMSTVHSQFNKITANEPISVPLLHIQDPWRGVLNCKLAIACNGIPVMTDDSGAAPNRWIILKFTERFEGREDLTLADRLLAEIEGIAAWAVEGLRRLMINGAFTMPQSSLEERYALNDASSPLTLFAEDRLEVGPDYRTHKDDLWQSYRQWCLDTHNRLCNQHQFIRSLERALQADGVRYRKSIRIDNVVRTGLEGVRLKQCNDGVAPNVTPINRASRALADAPTPKEQKR